MKNNIKYKLILFNILIFMLSILFSGCSRDESEINEVSIVLGMSVDKISGDKPTLVTLEIINPSATKTANDMSEKENKPILEESAGYSIYDAIQNFTKSNSVILDFSHCNVIILSKELCSSGISEVMDYVNRDRQFRSTNWILIAENTAKEILENKILIDDSTSKGINSMMNKFKKAASILPVDLNNFIIDSKSEAKTSFAPVIEIQKSNDINAGKIIVEKTAIFKNNRLLGILTNEESRNLLWLWNNKNGHTVVFPLSSSKNNEKLTVEVTKKSSKIIPQITEDGLNFKIECTGNAFIKDVQNITFTPELTDKIQHNTEIILKNQINHLINKSQKELNADFVCLSRTISNDHPKQWLTMKKDWDKIYPNIKYEVNFKIKITNIGIIKDSAMEND